VGRCEKSGRKQRGRIDIEINDGLGMSAHDGAGASRSDGTRQCVLHRFGFAAFRDAADQLPGTHQQRARCGKGLRRDAGEIRKVSLTRLLPAAALVEAHSLDAERIVEIRDVRIVECDVPILSDPQRAQVDGRRSQGLLVAAAFGIKVPRVPIEIINGSRVDSLHEVSVHPVLEAAAMTHGQVDVLVHVEKLESRPIKILEFHKG